MKSFSFRAFFSASELNFPSSVVVFHFASAASAIAPEISIIIHFPYNSLALPIVTTFEACKWSSWNFFFVAAAVLRSLSFHSFCNSNFCLINILNASLQRLEKQNCCLWFRKFFICRRAVAANFRSLSSMSLLSSLAILLSHERKRGEGLRRWVCVN